MSILPKRGIVDLSSAISACEKKAKGTALTCGNSKMTFGDDKTRPPKNAFVGVQRNMAKPGVILMVPFMKNTDTEY